MCEGGAGGQDTLFHPRLYMPFRRKGGGFPNSTPTRWVWVKEDHWTRVGRRGRSFLLIWGTYAWYVPSLRYTRGLGWRMHCGVKVTESSTNKQHHIYRERSLRLHVAGLVEGSRRCWKEGSAPVPQSLCNELSAPVRETPKSRFFSPNNVQSVCRRTCRHV